MKKIVLFVFILLAQNITTAQSNKKTYPFHIEIKGQGVPLILIPGLACSGDVWKNSVDSLSSNYECHVLTLPGFAGQEPIPLDKGYLPNIKTNIIAYIQKNFDQKPIIIGHSLGGFLAMDLASTHSSLLKSITIVDSYPFMSAAFNPNATEDNMLSQASMMKQMTINATDSIFTQQQTTMMPSMIHDKKQIETAIEWSLQSDRSTIAEAMFELMTTDLRDDIETIEIPVLILGSWYGAKDYGINKEMIRQVFEGQYIKVKNHQIKIAETAKHFIMLDEPDWFLTQVLNFISDAE